MPSVTVLPAATRSWGLAATVALGTVGTVADLLQQGLEIRARAIATADVDKTTYSDTGRKEEHDAHRKSLIEEFQLLKDAIDGPAATETTTDDYVPWSYFQPTNT